MPRNFFVKQNNSKSTIVVFTNHDLNQQYPVTYLQWNETDIDTIKSEFVHFENGSIFLNRLWYNGELKWKFQDGDENYEKYGVSNYLEIVK